MVKIPERLKVGCQTYKILYPWVFQEDDAMVGLHENRECVIKIAGTYRGEEMPSARVKQTLIHEVLHAVDFYYTCHILTEDETIIDRFASGWFNVLMNNKLNFCGDEFKLPKTLKIQDYLYKVLYPYKYLDLYPAPLFSVDTNMCIVKFSDEHLRASIDILKMNTVHAINVILNCENDILASSKLCNNGNIGELPKDVVLELLSNGFTQVIMDNNLEKVIRDG